MLGEQNDFSNTVHNKPKSSSSVHHTSIAMFRIITVPAFQLCP